MSDHLAIADRLFTAIAAGDIDTVRAVYAPNARIWHNFDDADQPAEQNLKVLRWVVATVKDLRYDDVRRLPTPEGFVQQHVLRGTVNGTPLAIPACIIATLRDGRITRLDEYIDSAHAAPLMAAARPR
jgi:ketosteroid isomerase-like protein